MDKSLKIKGFFICLCFLFVCAGLVPPFACNAAVKPAAPSLDSELKNALVRSIRCKNIVVQTVPSKDKPGEIKTLTVKLEGATLGAMTADYVTVIYEKPVIDMVLLKKSKKFKLISSASGKTGILISKSAMEKYIAARIKRYGKKSIRVSVKFTPPYAECFFNVAASEIDPQILKLVGKYIQGKNLEGYAAVQLKADNNALTLFPAKLILNHFLVPGTVCGELQNTVGTVERVPVPAPLKYSVNHVSIQKNYVFLTN